MADPVSLGITLALAAFNTGLTMTRPIEGAKLDDTRIMSADYGAALLRVWGRRRITPQMFFAEDLTHVEQERKTKGGKLNSHTYFATFGVALAVKAPDATAAIAGVRRIWFDDKLVFDMSGAGPVTPFDFAAAEPAGAKGGSGAGAGGYAINEHMAVYLGTMDQEPDPRMQATVDARTGVENSCPAYHGIAYIVFKDMPVEKFGNRIPLVSVEVVTETDGVIPTEVKDLIYGPNATFNATFSPDYTRMAWISDGGFSTPANYEIWDVAARSRMIAGTMVTGIPSTSTFGVMNDGTILKCGYFDDKVWAVTPEGQESLYADCPGSAYSVSVIADGEGNEHWGTHPPSAATSWYFDGTLYTLGWQANQYARDTYGNVWVIGRVPAAGSSTTTVYFQRLVTVDNTPGWPVNFSVTMPTAQGPTSSGEGVNFVASGDQFLVFWGGALYFVDPATLAVSAATVSGISFAGMNRNRWNALVPGSGTIWLGNKQVDIATGTVIRTESSIDTTSYRSVYDPLNHAIILNTGTSISGGGRDELTWYYVDRMNSTGVTLGDIVSDVCAASGVDAAQIDVTALTQSVTGYSVSTGSGKDWLGPLLDLYDIDPRPHGFQLEFLPRGGAAGATISSEGFAISGEGGDTPLFTSPADAATDMLAMATLQFADSDKDQEAGNAKSPALFDAGSKRTLSMNLPGLALSATEARQLVTRYVRRTRFDAKRHAFALPASSVALEPGDVHSLDLRGVTVTARCVSLVAGADRRIDTEWKRDDPSVAVLDDAEGAAADGQTADTVSVALLSKGFVLDIPLLRDVDSSSLPLLHVAAAPWALGSWAGATIYESVDGEYSDEFATISPANRATWGYANAALGAPGSPWVWDRGQSVNVTLQVGSLSGCTEADVDANPLRNLCLIGDELVNFTTATLEGDGSYTLSGFKRGRRGTEWACGTHAARDVFLLMSSPASEARGLSDVGQALSFKAASAMRSTAGAYPISLTFTGASLKPYAPVHLAGTLSGGDWALGWTRRTRVGGAWTNYTGTPLSEASEAYEVDVMDGPDVVRTITGLSSPAATYTAAQQVTDFGGAQSSVTFRVYQISDAVGRGFRAEATV